MIKNLRLIINLCFTLIPGMVLADIKWITITNNSSITFTLEQIPDDIREARCAALRNSGPILHGEQKQIPIYINYEGSCFTGDAYVWFYIKTQGGLKEYEIETIAERPGNTWKIDYIGTLNPNSNTKIIRHDDRKIEIKDR